MESIEELAEKYAETLFKNKLISHKRDAARRGFIEGYNKALERDKPVSVDSLKTGDTVILKPTDEYNETVIIDKITENGVQYHYKGSMGLLSTSKETFIRGSKIYLVPTPPQH